MEQTKQFLSLIDPETDKHLFAAYDYRKKKKGRQYFGTLEEYEDTLKANNEDVYCIYSLINQSGNGSRKKEDITRCRAIWVEDDEERAKPRVDFPIDPSIIVESSPNKFHYYWLTSTVDTETWDQVMKTMVTEHGCDKNARDISRVMRLPGFNHRKKLKADPFICRIVESNGKRYKWFEIKKHFPPLKKSEKKESKSDDEFADFDLAKAIKDIQESNNYHGSLASMSMSLSNRNMGRDEQYVLLKAVMDSVPEAKRREEWEERAGKEHLYECIDSAIAKVEAEKDEEESEYISLDELDDVEDDEVEEIPIEYPPGLFGKLCEEIYEMAPHPNREVALSAGLGVIAGIVGRTYNVSGAGLNVYITLLADTGIGKSNIKNTVNYVLNTGAFNLGSSRIGPSRITGPKAIYNALLSNKMSCVSVLEEAGFMHESTAGDGAGITRVLLDLYTSSGYGIWSSPEEYSDTKNRIPALHSPALSIVSVSTPKIFIQALNNKRAEQSGELGRMMTLRSMGKKKYFNKNRRKNISKEHLTRVQELLTDTAANQSSDPEHELETHDVEIQEFMYGDSDYYVDKENEAKENHDMLRASLYSRSWMKCLKLAAIVSVYNGKVDEIGAEEYKWAKKLVDDEVLGIQANFSKGVDSDLEHLADTIVKPVIVKILNGKKKSHRANEELIKRGIITATQFKQAFVNNRILAELDDDQTRNNPKKGIEKVLAYMERIDMIQRLKQDKIKSFGSRAKVAYMISEGFLKSD